MSETERPSDERMARMLRQHLASLQAAGVEWAPVGNEPLKPAAPAAASPAPAPQPNVLVPHPADNAPPAAEQRRVELAQLAEQVAACTRCPHLASTRTQT